MNNAQPCLPGMKQTPKPVRGDYLLLSKWDLINYKITPCSLSAIGILHENNLQSDKQLTEVLILAYSANKFVSFTCLLGFYADAFDVD